MTKVKEYLKLRCSFFNNTFSKPAGEVTVGSLFDGSLSDRKITTYDWTGEDIKEELKGFTAQKLDKALANYVAKNGKDDDYQRLKEYQVAITPSGLFDKRRTYDEVLEQHPVLIVDIDKDGYKPEQFKKYPYVIGAGESMSRKGVWVLVAIENATLFKEHFFHLRTNVFPEADDLKDITRLRYIAFGKTWCRKGSEVITPYSETLPLPTDDAIETKQLKPTTKHDNIDEVRSIISSVGSITECGGLHPFTVRVASRANKKGISSKFGADTVWNLISSEESITSNSRYTFPRFKHDWDSIYNTYKHEHHIQTKVRITKGKVNRFNESIYSRSPKLLQDLVGLAEQQEEKEVVYFSALMLLGSLFPNRAFRYFNNTYYPSLYGYILGDAASFKGKAKILRTAMKPYIKKVNAERERRVEDRVRAIAHNKDNKDAKIEVPKVPDMFFMFDGNTSSAAMMKAMADSPYMVLFETEGDTITKTWKTDWGNYSDMLRKAFEHEHLSSMKKSQEENLQHLYIEKPKLSVLVSSTENQMRKVLNADETENGLMSRFLFYIVQNDKKWYNGFDSNTDQDIESIIVNHIPVDLWYQWLHDEKDNYYTLSQDAIDLHQTYFNHVNDNWPDELFNVISLIRRAGTSCIRIAMLIEELRKLEREKAKAGLVARANIVSLDSMLLAIDIMKVLLQHLFVAWQLTYKSEDFKETNVQEGTVRAEIAKILSNNLDAGYRQIAKQVGVSATTVMYHVKKLKGEIDEKKRGVPTATEKSKKKPKKSNSDKTVDLEL